ncbi:MAG: helix-turn-helix domain-containing protein [Ignavibacteriales bacterium]|nr:MAG: helix-turn-helix domain-containing protein [Ignavibacteriales bacterium]
MLTDIHKASTNIHKVLTDIHKASTNIHKVLIKIHKVLTNIHKVLTNIHKVSTDIHKVSTDIHKTSLKLHEVFTNFIPTFSQQSINIRQEINMLTYNLQLLFRQRAIKNPVSFLMKAGFNRQTALRIKNNKFKALKLSQVEKLCIALYCTPNDLIQYIPNPQKPISNHPLTNLVHKEQSEHLANFLDDIPIEKLSGFTQQIKQLKTQLLNT